MPKDLSLIEAFASLKGLSGGVIQDVFNIVGDLAAIAASPQGVALITDIAQMISDIKNKNLAVVAKEAPDES
jgi:hypothetical protein